MKQFCMFVLCLSLLTATSMLMPSVVEAKKLKFKTITASQSGIVLDIDGYETKYQGTGWNANYSHEQFRAKIDRYNQRLAVSFYLGVLAPGYLWSNSKRGLEAHIRKGSQFKNYIVRFAEKFGRSESGSYDSDNKRGAAKFEIDHPNFKTCYYFGSVPHFGESADFNPTIQLEICAKEDLNLSIKNPEKFFIIDDRNEKVRLDLSYQNLGQKIAALKTSTPSTASGSTVTNNQKNCQWAASFITKMKSERLCGMALNGSRTDWDLNPDRMISCQIAEAKKRFAISPITECQKLLGASVTKDTEMTDNGNRTITDRLKALKKLEDAGLISKEEAAAKRQEILKNL